MASPRTPSKKSPAAKPAEKPVRRKAALPTHVGAGELAALVGLTDRRIRAMEAEGIIAKAERGTYPLRETIQAILTYAREVEQRKAASTAGERLKERKDEELQRKMAREERLIVDLDDAMTAIDEIVGLFTESYAGMPSRLTRDPKEQQRLADIFAEERNRLAAGFLEKAQALRTGLAPSEDDSEDDA